MVWLLNSKYVVHFRDITIHFRLQKIMVIDFVTVTPHLNKTAEKDTRQGGSIMCSHSQFPLYAQVVEWRRNGTRKKFDNGKEERFTQVINATSHSTNYVKKHDEDFFERDSGQHRRGSWWERVEWNGMMKIGRWKQWTIKIQLIINC